MPTSQHHQISNIIDVIVTLDPRSVLDVGTGFGKYGVLAREYLGGWDGNMRNNGERRIDGIEGFPGYLSPLHEYVYDNLYRDDIRSILSRLDTHYDLALCIDVIEHFDSEDGCRVLAELQRRASNVLISTPKTFFPQQAEFGNDLEAHRSLWTPENLIAVAPCCFIPDDFSVICLMGSAAPRIRKRYSFWPNRIGRKLRYLASAYRKWGRTEIRA